MSIGKPSAKPSPEQVALRSAGRAPATLPSASLNSRPAEPGFSMRSRRTAVGDQDAGAEQDAFAAALGRGRPDRFEDYPRFPEVAAVVQGDAVAQRRMPRRHVPPNAAGTSA